MNRWINGPAILEMPCWASKKIYRSRLNPILRKIVSPHMLLNTLHAKVEERSNNSTLDQFGSHLYKNILFFGLGEEDPIMGIPNDPTLKQFENHLKKNMK